MFKRQLKFKLPLNVDELLGKHLSKDYPLARLFKEGFPKAVPIRESPLMIEIGRLNRRFRSQMIDGYQVEVAVMYFDFVHMESSSDSSISPIVPLTHSGLLRIELDTGNPGDRYMISFKIAACCKGIPQSENSAMAMQIIQTGIV